jgi:hypothetical protein
MALIDKLTPPDNLPAHEFMGGVFMWAIGDWNRARMISQFELETSDEAQLDALAAEYTSIAGAAGKLEYLLKLEQGVILYQTGHMTAGELGTLLNI